MKKKRLYTLGGLILCMLLLLCGRLMQIQLFQTEDFSKYGVNLLEGSVNQRVQQLVIDEGRGQFIDRNGQPLTFEEKKVLVLFPFLKQEEDILGQVADILDLSPTTLKNAVVQAKEPFILEGYNGQPLELSDREMTRISNLKVPGLMAVEKIYGKDKPSAAHLLGLIKENKEEFERRYDSLPKNSKPLLGITGLQKQFDELLRPDGEAKLVYHVDGIGEPLFGL
ncbi:MAG TPA: hypothetical protein VEY51_10215, partial [Chondromyces sp.]|nr:hypothetical protein [Chondromyces sp.]